MSNGHTVIYRQGGGAFIEGDKNDRLQKMWIDKDECGKVFIRAEWLQEKDNITINEFIAYFDPVEAMRLSKAFETMAIAALKDSA